jgi:hypothetical protein
MYTLDATDSFSITSPADTYVYDIVPTAAGLVTISSDDSLRLLDPLALDTPLNTIKRVNTDVTCIVVIEGGGGVSSLIGTAGRDGRLVLTDLRCEKVGEIKSGKWHFCEYFASRSRSEFLLLLASFSPSKMCSLCEALVQTFYSLIIEPTLNRADIK